MKELTAEYIAMSAVGPFVRAANLTQHEDQFCVEIMTDFIECFQDIRLNEAPFFTKVSEVLVSPSGEEILPNTNSEWLLKLDAVDENRLDLIVYSDLSYIQLFFTVLGDGIQFDYLEESSRECVETSVVYRYESKVSPDEWRAYIETMCQLSADYIAKRGIYEKQD